MIKGSDDLVGAIARNLSESVETPASMKGEHKCEICGATYTVDTEEYGAATCPVCGTLPADKTADANVDEQDVVNGLEELAKEYADAVKNEDFDKANEIAKECEEQDAKIVTESLASGGTAIVLEKYIKKVDSNGNITKVKVKTKKKRLTSGQKQALRKARKLAHKGQANRKRKKAMKIRKRKGLSESLIARNLKIMTESLGRTPSASEISNMTARVKFVTEALEFDETEKIVDVLTAAFFERNIDVIDSVTGTRGKAITVEITLQDDPDEEVYLGEVADQVEDELGHYVVAYEEPITNEDGDVEVKFVFVDSTGLEESLEDDTQDSENFDDEDSEDDEFDDEFDEDEANECTDPKNESVLVSVGDEDDDALDSVAGGKSNVLCEIDPQFLKVGQTAYDAEDKTVFTVLTAPEEVDEGFRFSAEIIKSANQELAILPRGTKITVTSDSEYYLLRKAPIA